MKKYKELADIIKSYGYDLVDSSTFYFGDDIPKRKIINAIGSYAKGIEIDKVIGLVDTTLFGSAKEGIIFTNASMYIKETMDKPKEISYDSIDYVKVLKTDRKNDSDKVLEVVLVNNTSIILKSTLYKKTVLKSILDKIINLREEGKIGSDKKYIAIEYASDKLKVFYIKVIVNFISIGKDIDFRELSECYSLMSQIRIGIEGRQNIIDYLKGEKEPVEYILEELDKLVLEESKEVYHYSLIKDLIRVGKADGYDLDSDQIDFISEILRKYKITETKFLLLEKVVKIDKGILTGEIKDRNIVKSVRELAVSANYVNMSPVSFYLSGSVIGISASGISFGFAALGLSRILEFSSLINELGVSICLGVGSYKRIRWITTNEERDKTRKSEFLIQEVIKNNQETIKYLVDHINVLTIKVVELLNDSLKNKEEIDTLSKEIGLLSEVFSSLRLKNRELEKLLYDIVFKDKSVERK